MNSLHDVQSNIASAPPQMSAEAIPPTKPTYNSVWNSPMRPPAAFAADPRCKSPVLATLLSLMPGLGQVYIGYYRQGFINFTVVASLIAILNIDTLDHSPIIPFLAFFLAFFWLFNLVDAQRRAVYYNQMMITVESFELPDSFKTGSKEGNLGSGILLILIGILGLAHTMFNMSLDWLREWWPLAIVGFGAYLVGRAIWDYRRQQG